MKISKFNNLLIIISLLVFLSMDNLNVIGNVQLGILYSTESEAPVIDGVFSSGEWAQGKPIEPLMSSSYNSSDNFTIQLMSVYDKEENIFFGITTPLFNLSYSQEIYIEFLEYGYALSDRNDVKAFDMHYNRSYDLYDHGNKYDENLVETEPITNETVYGQENTEGKCHYNETHVTIEMMFPMNSHELTSIYDIRLFPGYDYQLHLFYNRNETYYHGYTQWDVNNYSYYLLSIQEKTGLFGDMITPLFLISIAVFVIIQTTKRKK